MSNPVKTENKDLEVTRGEAIKIYNSLVGLTNQVAESGAPIVSAGWVAFSRTMANLEPLKKHYDDFLKPLREKLQSLETPAAEEGEKKKLKAVLTEKEIEEKRKEVDKEVEAYLEEKTKITVRTIPLSKIEGEKHNAMLMQPLWDTVLVED
jgi:hypothetical protein